jgi:hypothetical protein
MKLYDLRLLMEMYLRTIQHNPKELNYEEIEREFDRFMGWLYENRRTLRHIEDE